MCEGFEPLWMWGRVSLYSGQGVRAVGSSLPAPAPACDAEAFGGGLDVPNLLWGNVCMCACVFVCVCIRMHCVLCIHACLRVCARLCVSAEH